MTKKPKSLRQRVIDREPAPRHRVLSMAIRYELRHKPIWTGALIGDPPQFEPVIRITPAKPEHAEKS